MEKYIVNNNTVALLKKKNITIVYEKNKKFIVNQKLNKIISFNCRYYGSNLEGRLISTKELLNIKYKVPIIIYEYKNMIFSYLNNKRDKTCLLVNLNMLVFYKKYDNYLYLKFLNNNGFRVKISEYNLEKLIINHFKINNLINCRKKMNFL